MTYFIDQHGCAKNQVDAETMMLALARAGWTSVDDAELADLIIVNSCGFIESAKKESIDAVLSFKAVYPGKKLLLAGCLSQRYADELASDLNEADALFGNADLSLIAQAADLAMRGGQEALRPELDPAHDAEIEPYIGDRPLLSLPGSAYLKITEGCDNHCSFCAIPIIRGSLRSRSVADIAAEARELLARGVRELCLIGQDLGSFGVDREGVCRLPELLRALSGLPGDFWVRLLYIHPDNFPLEILPVIAADRRILPYFDLPFQHGSERILRAMNRRGTSEGYLRLIALIRSSLPDAIIRSTFLLGFPGETDEDFRLLRAFQDAARLDWLGSFTYSREEDTVAWGLGGRVPKKLALARQKEVECAQQPISEERMERFVGQTLELLVEEKVQNEEGLYLARAWCQAPEVDGATVLSSSRDLEPGMVCRARIVRRNGFDLDAVALHG